MVQKIKAIYRDGFFIPESACSLAENTTVEITISPSCPLTQEIIDPEARQEILKRLLQRMRQSSTAS